MGHSIGLLLAVPVIASLCACTTALAPEQTDALGMPFNDQLKSRYLQLASHERNDLDWDYFHYRQKAEASLLGDMVAPDVVGDHEICVPMQPDSLALQERLAALLDDGGRIKAPALAAEAQVNFDCWLDELEEISADTPELQCKKVATERPSQCRDRLLASLDHLERALTNPGATYAIFFKTGSTDLDESDLDMIDEVAHAADLVEPAMISVTGFADRRGQPGFNADLSTQRAEAVAKALIRQGVPAATIDVRAGGETNRGQSMDENRRVEIAFEN